jgi:hypothetical protein
MSIALISFALSGAILLLLSVLYVYEDAQGHRVFLISFRSWLDRSFTSLFGWSIRLLSSIARGTVRFVLRYGVYSFLGIIVARLKRWEQRVENIVMRNRRHVRKERTTRTHLDDIADHKQSVALSEKEKRQMRDE